MPDRKCRSSTCITIELGENYTSQWQYFCKGFGGIDRILSLHGIDDKQCFSRLQQLFQLTDFPHHGFVDTQSSGGIDDYHVMMMLTCKIQGCSTDFSRLPAGLYREEIGSGLFSQQRQLIDCRGAINVAGHQQDLFLLIHQPFRQFAAAGGFTGTLQPCHENDSRRSNIQIEFRLVAAHDGDQLLMNNTDECLARREFVQYFVTDCTLLDLLDEYFDDRQGYICLDQGHAYLAQRILNIAFSQACLTTQRFDDTGKSFG